MTDEKWEEFKQWSHTEPEYSLMDFVYGIVHIIGSNQEGG